MTRLVRNDPTGKQLRLLALSLCLSTIACGEDTSNKGTTQDSTQGDGDGDRGNDKANLANGVVGTACDPNSNTCTGGTCASELTGGTIGQLGDALPAPSGYCTGSCTQDSQCGEGGVCFGSILGSEGECRRSCKASSDCAEGQECATTNLGLDSADAGIDFGQFQEADTCQPLPPKDQLGPDQAGKSCSEDAECGEGRCAEGSNAAGGYCTGRCASDGDCGSGGICIPGIYGSAGSCREACSKDSDCQNDAMGWGCGEVGGKQACIRKGEPLPAGVVGKACTRETEETDCATGSCREVGFLGERYPGGYCIGRCTADSDCGGDGVCISGQTCLKRCGGDAECRPEYTCRKHPSAPNSPATICFPRAMTGGDAG